MDLHGGGGPDQVCQDQVFDDDDVVMDEMGAPPPMPESAADVPDPPDPLQEQSQPEFGPDGPAEASMRSAFDVWHRLVHDARMVGVKNLTFTEVILFTSCQRCHACFGSDLCTFEVLGLTCAQNPL